jgi:Tol biopolymer transport system component
VNLRLALVAIAVAVAMVACGGGSSSNTAPSGTVLPGSSPRAVESKGDGKLLIAGLDGIIEFDVSSESSKPLIPLPQENSYVLDPDVSPDGTTIAFVLQPPPKVSGTTYDAGSDLWVANRDGSGQRAVFTHDTPNQLVRFPQWEDAGHLLAVVQEITETGSTTSVTYTLERIDVGTGQREHLLEDVLAFGLSPDRKQLAFAKLLPGTGETLETMPLASATVGATGTVIVGPDEELAPFNAPRYSPDGTTIAFASADQTGARSDQRYVTSRGFGPPAGMPLDGLPEDIWTVAAAGGARPQRVADIKEDLPWLTWNGDGTRIYVIGAAALYDVNLKSGGVSQIGKGTFHGQVTWTP